MAKFIRSLMLPNYSSLLVMLMARIAIYEDGIGIQNAGGKTIAGSTSSLRMKPCGRSASCARRRS